MKLKYKIFITLAVICIITVCILVIDTPLQKSVRIERDTVGPFPICGEEAEIELSPGLSFRLSTSAPVCRITPNTLAWLRDKGYVTDSMTRWVISRDNSNTLRLTDKVYRVNLPLATYRVGEYDSIAGHHILTPEPFGRKGFLYDVDVVPAAPGDENTLGGIFIGNFVVEYIHDSNAVMLHKELPPDYDYLASFKIGNRFSDMLGTGVRYYIDMKVDHESYSFLINTALNDIAMKMPFDRIDWNENDAVKMERIIDAAGDQQDAVVDQSAWIEFGNRAGSRRIHYFTDRGENFEINPFVFFQQDVVLDFPNKAIYLRPFYDMDDKTG